MSLDLGVALVAHALAGYLLGDCPASLLVTMAVRTCGFGDMRGCLDAVVWFLFFVFARLLGAVKLAFAKRIPYVFLMYK